MNRRHGSCRGSWDTYGCRDMDPETWILQRILRYNDTETWIRRRGSCRGSWEKDAEPWIRRHGSCRESMRYKDAETWIRRRGSCRGSIFLVDAKTGCCRGPWDIKMLRHESQTWISQRILRYIWMLRYGSGDMDLAEDPEIHMDGEPWIQRHGSCRGASDTKMLRHESEDVDLVEDPYCWMLRHESETWLLQRILRYEACRRHRHLSCEQLSCDLQKVPLLMSSYTLFGVAWRYNCLYLLVSDACFTKLFPCCFSFLLACSFVFLVFCSPSCFVRLPRLFACFCLYLLVPDAGFALLFPCCFSFLLVCFLAFLVFCFPELLCQTPRRSGKIFPRSGKIFLGSEKNTRNVKNIFRRGKDPFGSGKYPVQCKKKHFAEAAKNPCGSGKNISEARKIPETEKTPSWSGKTPGNTVSKPEKSPAHQHSLVVSRARRVSSEKWELRRAGCPKCQQNLHRACARERFGSQNH